MPDPSTAPRRSRRCSARPLGSWVAALVTAAVLAGVGAAGPLAAGAAGATPEQVRASIRRGVDSLYRTQQAGGQQWEDVAAPNPEAKKWQPAGGQWGGKTALATYALLAAGENPQDPRLLKAVDFLKRADLVGLYAIGMRSQVWTFLPAGDETRLAARRDADLLGKSVAQKGPYVGTWGYVVDQDVFRFDLSVSQYGVLGMWASSREIEVPTTFWAAVERTWLGQQQPSGGWAYKGAPDADDPITPAITAAGVATLFITQEYLHADAGVACRGNVDNPNIAAGINYLSAELPGLLAAGTFKDRLYTLYGVERIGVASGLKYLDKLDWYKAGADFLIRTQNGDGSWSGDRGGNGPSTSFALLFLARGGAPVMVNKLQYAVLDRRGKPEAGDWNQRPRDAANVTRYVGRQTERDLNWQVVDLDAAAVTDLHDAPIAYLAGDQDLTLSDAQKAKLKRYVEQGGLIFGTADCARRPFAAGFQKLGQELFPGHEFRKLPEGHPILSNQQFNSGQWRRKPDVLALSNGTRELMILVPDDDAGRAYQKGDLSAEPLFQLMANVYLYATDKQKAQLKGDTHVVEPDPKVATTRTVGVARVRYDGNWNPEPAGWDRLAAVLRNGRKVDLKVETVDLKDLASAEPRVAHLTGTGAFKPTDDQKAALKGYVASGGTLIVDAAGGSGEFATSVEQALTDVFGADAAGGLSDPLPATSAAYQLDGKPPGKIEYRDFARAKVLGALDGPRVRAIAVDGRPAVFYSPDDLSTGLVGQPVDGIVGYAPATATDLMTRLVLNAAGK